MEGLRVKMKIRIIQCISVVFILICTRLAFAGAASDLQPVVKGNTEFGCNLFQELKGKKGNLFFSPYSISTALAMTYAGARGRTEKEMAEVLHFSLGQDTIHSSFAMLQSDLNTIQKKGYIKLSVANSLWSQKGYRFLDSFLEINKKNYGAGLNVVDFIAHTEAARKTINTWVEKKTEKKIKDLIPKSAIKSSARLVLCNAIYFKGDWLHPFDKKETLRADFHVSREDTITVRMMNQRAPFKFVDFNSFSAIELPYSGNDLSMVIFLPKEIDGLANLEKDFTSDNVSRWISELSQTNTAEVLVSIPLFKITGEFMLSDTLSIMGMPHAFQEADFSGMTGKDDLRISNVIHKAFVDVNEKGTEAAAATAIIMVLTCMPNPAKTLIFQGDHPFIFIIRDIKTGSILLVGRIADPSQYI